LNFQKDIALTVAIAAIFSGLLNPVFSVDFASATSEEGGDNGGGLQSVIDLRINNRYTYASG
jgi:hypothetical protein